MSKAALEFLQEHGHQSLISLGCGEKLNRLDNHIKLLIGCGLKYYVGIVMRPPLRPDAIVTFVPSASRIWVSMCWISGSTEPLNFLRIPI